MADVTHASDITEKTIPILPCRTLQPVLDFHPGGNCLRIGRQTSEDPHHRPAPKDTFARALHHASLLADPKEDPAGAAKIIDRTPALEDERPTPVQLLPLLTLRVDTARRLGDEETAASALREAAAIHLTAEERHSVRDDLIRLAELRA